MREPRWPVAVGLVVGVAMGAVGVQALLDTHPGTTLRWVVGLALAHDLVLVPVVLVVGVAVRRVVPARARPAVVIGLVTSGVLGLFAWPFVRGYGRQAHHPSLLPRNYGRGLLVAWAVTWLVVGAGGLVAARRSPRGPSPRPRPPRRSRTG